MMSTSNPEVSIIIPVVDNLKHNRECLESVFENTACGIPYEIVIIDNNSTDGSREYFESLGNKIRLVANDSLKTFAQSCNQGAENAAGKYLLFLNNDTYVTPSWLPPLFNCIESKPEIGIVGNKQIYPQTNLINHAGGAFNPNKTPEHIYQFFDPDLPFINRDRECQWVTACCLIISKSLFFKVNGFDTTYKNSYEDVDLCLKVRNKGYNILYCHESLIYHYGQATDGRSNNEVENQKLFFQRWKHKFQADILKMYEEDNPPKYLKKQHNLERILLDRHHVQHNARDWKHQALNQKKVIESIFNTLSWRITAPIRGVKQLFIKLRKENRRSPIASSQQQPSDTDFKEDLMHNADITKPGNPTIFFEINDPDYKAEEIGKQIFQSLKNRNIPLEEERNRLEAFDLEMIKKEFYNQPKIRFKLLLHNLPRWIIRFDKHLPFYEAVRKRLLLNK